MTTLFLDLASRHQYFALVSGERTIGRKAMDDHTAEEQLLPAIESLLHERNLGYADLARMAVNLGPGGFMSLRVGVSIANALSFGLSLPSAGIHGSDLWGRRAQAHGRFVWLHSTKREQLFVRGFGEQETTWPKPHLITLAELCEKLPHDCDYVGELIPEHAQQLRPRALLENIRTTEDVLPGLLRTLPYQKGQILLPWYGREW